MSNIQLTDIQKNSIINAYQKANARSVSHGDMNTICQSIGQREGIEFMLDVLGIKWDDIKDGNGK